jgi:hypothetical protein
MTSQGTLSSLSRLRINADSRKQMDTMQKSALTNRPANPSDAKRGLPPLEKGQKFEPFWTAAFGSDRQSLARQQKSDQKR